MTIKSTEENATEIPLAIGKNARSELAGVAAPSAAMAAVRVGLAHLIHEITNPLHMIYSTVGLLEQELPKASAKMDPFILKAIPQLKSEVDQLIALVGSLRSQLECLWSANSSTDTVDLSSLLDQAVESESARFQAKAVLIHKDFPAKLPAIKAIEKLLKQAILNLLRNAVDAMPQGGTLNILAGVKEQSVYLELADTGVGIPANLDIFQPFATTKEQGMGLGLAITRHLVEAHGGTIGYRSKPGEGTTFCLTFPMAQAAEKLSTLT
jgi:two-component system, sporulation sensor kinase E